LQLVLAHRQRVVALRSPSQGCGFSAHVRRGRLCGTRYQTASGIQVRRDGPVDV